MNEQEMTPEPQNPAPTPNLPIASEDLFRGSNEVLIRHGDETYRLRLTRNGKLILQK